MLKEPQYQGPELDFGRHNPKLDFGGHKCLFHVKSYLTVLFGIGNIAVWGAMAPWICPCPVLNFLSSLSSLLLLSYKPPSYKTCLKQSENTVHTAGLSLSSRAVAKTIITKQLLAFLKRNNLLSDHQYGFRQARSTGDLLAYAVHAWSSALESYGESRVISLDISKAFDRVWHKRSSCLTVNVWSYCSTARTVLLLLCHLPAHLHFYPFICTAFLCINGQSQSSNRAFSLGKKGAVKTFWSEFPRPPFSTLCKGTMAPEFFPA